MPGLTPVTRPVAPTVAWLLVALHVPLADAPVAVNATEELTQAVEGPEMYPAAGVLLIVIAACVVMVPHMLLTV
jgi:hypothetical protein